MKGVEARKAHYHALELPVAQLCSIHANLNRDSKKNRKPYSAADFCFFIDHQEGRPEARAAGAYMRLAEEGLLPPWALFAFADFKGTAPSKGEIEELALIGEGVVLLAPREIDDGLVGLLLAEQFVSGQEVTARFRGEDVRVNVPKFDGFTIAKSEAEIDLVRPLDAPQFA